MDLARGFNIFQGIGPNYLGGLLENDARVAIHYTHRLGALLVTIYLLLLSLRLMAFGHKGVNGVAWVIAGALLLQLALGISNVLFQIPLPVAVAHNGGGALLLLTLITLATRVWMAQAEDKEQ